MPDRPASDELEISVFGAGTGECVLIHLGDGRWVVVDSMLDPGDPEAGPVALQYLERLGVDVATCVELVVVTHWHDDHVKGISAVVGACEAAAVCCSSAMGTKEMLAMLGVAAHSDRLSAPLQELAGVFETLEERARALGGRHPAPAWAVEGRSLIERPIGCEAVRLVAMTPSDETNTRARQAVAAALPANGEPLRVAAPSHNLTSVVLWLDRGPDAALLGADLEVSTSQLSGWRPIVRLASAGGWTAEYFKVPHHGSPNGHDDDVWKELLVADPVAVLTPYGRGRTKRPSPEDRERICSLTGRAHQAGSAGVPASLPPLVETLRRHGGEPEWAHGELGVVTARKRPGAEWVVRYEARAGELDG